MKKVSYKEMLKSTNYIFPIYGTEGYKMSNLVLAIRMLNKQRMIKIQQIPCYSVNKNGIECKYYIIKTRHKKLLLATNAGCLSKFEQIPKHQILHLEARAFEIIKQIQNAKNKLTTKSKLAKELEIILDAIF